MTETRDKFQSALRPNELGLRTMQALSGCAGPIAALYLLQMINADEPEIDIELLMFGLRDLELAGMVRNAYPLPLKTALWEMTDLGFAALAERTVGLKTRRAAHREGCLPLAVSVCVDEDDLDTWWAELDVENKADAWALYSLSHDSRVDVERRELRIPVAGATGGTEGGR